MLLKSRTRDSAVLVGLSAGIFRVVSRDVSHEVVRDVISFNLSNSCSRYMLLNDIFVRMLSKKN